MGILLHLFLMKENLGNSGVITLKYNIGNFFMEGSIPPSARSVLPPNMHNQLPHFLRSLLRGLLLNEAFQAICLTRLQLSIQYFLPHVSFLFYSLTHLTIQHTIPLLILTSVCLHC